MVTRCDPIARLREIAAARRALDDEEAWILNGLGGRAPSAPAIRRDRSIPTSIAARIMDCSYSAAYRRARRFSLGWKLPSGEWRFSENAVRVFVAGRRSAGEIGENGDERPLQLAMQSSESRRSGGDEECSGKSLK